MLATFAALAEPNRYRIVEMLRNGPRSVGEIGERLSLSQPLVSKHLRVLKESGLVDVEPQSRRRMYELRAKPLRELHGWLERYRKVWDAKFEQLDELLVELEADAKRKDARHARNDRK